MAKSLSQRLTYRIMAVVLVMMTVIAGVVYYHVRKYMLTEAEERYETILQENYQELRHKLSDVCAATHNNVHDIERDIDNPDQMYAHMERIVRENPVIVCCALLFEPGYYPDKGQIFVPCARRDSAGDVRVARIDSTYHRIYDEAWYHKQMTEDYDDWTKVYFESPLFAGDQAQRLLTSYTYPLHNRDGRPVALICSDLSLEWLRESLMDDLKGVIEKYEKGHAHQTYSFIVDSLGTYVIHPDETRMLTTLDDSHLTRVLKDGKGTAKVTIDGVKSWICYRDVEDVEWTMVVVVPEEVLLSGGRGLNVIILLTMALGLLAISLFCRHQIKEITNPVAAEKASLERELKIANGIQMAMLPKNDPSALVPPSSSSDAPRYDLYASLTPARDVGGDLYDYFLRDDRLFFCIGDVSGKGVPAALMMAVMRAMFRSETRRTNSAAAIVDTMNRNLSEEYTAGYFITMFVGVLDLTSGKLDYCNAGHEAPILSEKGKERCVPLPVEPNLPVGALPDWNYEGQEAQLQPGDLLFLYTDGLSEAMNPTGEQLGRKHVLQLASEHSGDTARQLVEFMESEVKRHAGDAEQSDDITLLAIRWQPQAIVTRHSSFVTRHSSFVIQQLKMRPSIDDIGRLEPFVTTVSQQAGLDDKEANRLRLAVEEAVINVINYGEATTILLQATMDDDQLQVTIDDDGVPFDPTAGSPTDFSLPPDERPPGGLGIMLLHEMTDGLEYHRIDGHNILTIKKNRKILKPLNS